MELLSALLGLEQMEPFCSLPTGRFILLPQRSIPALHHAASSRELPLLPLWILEPNPCFPPFPGLADVSPLGLGLQPPGSRPELLHSSPQHFCLHPSAAAQSPELRHGPGKRLFILSENAWQEDFSFQESPGRLQVFPRLMLSGERVRALRECTKQQQLRAESQRLKRNFGNSSRHTLQRIPSPLPTVFTFISWSERIFEVRKEEKKKKQV